MVRLEDGSETPYDFLIVATGATHSYFGHDAWAPWAPGLKTLDDALEIRARILLAFERAERETDPAKRAAWLTFVVIGGGAAGVELAGTLAEIARQTLRGEFRRYDPRNARVVLVEFAWLWAHIYFLINFRNRIVVMIDWAWSYWTLQRYSRIVIKQP